VLDTTTLIVPSFTLIIKPLIHRFKPSFTLTITPPHIGLKALNLYKKPGEPEKQTVSPIDSLRTINSWTNQNSSPSAHGKNGNTDRAQKFWRLKKVL
jgi:hypothetical protein